MAVTKKKIDHKAISHTMFTLKSRFKVDLNISLKELKNNLVKQGYDPSLINEHLERIGLLNRIHLITERDTRQKSDRIPLVITYN